MPRARTAPIRPIHTAIAALFAAALVVGCGASGNTFTAPSTSAKCGVTTTAAGATLPAGGGTASIAVSTERECQWTASSDGTWLTITAGTSGQGPGKVEVAAAVNPNPAPRTASILINDQRVSLSQAAAECRFDLAQASGSMPAAGGTGSVGVRASNAACTWTASSEASWISITSGASGTGTGTVTFDVGPSPGAPRSGTLRIAGQPFTVTQAQACAVTVAATSASLGMEGGSGRIDVTAGDGCGWAAASSAPWLIVTSGASGSGTGAVLYSAGANSGPARTGTITIAEHTVTVTQAGGCTVALSSSSQSVASDAATASVGVTAGAGCLWSAASNAPWISVTGGATGSGNGTVQLAIDANPGDARTGSVTIAGQTFTVTQAAAAPVPVPVPVCSYILSATSQNVPASGGSGSFTVSTGPACAWTTSSSAAWLAATPSSGSGPITVLFTAAANAGGARSATITVAGQVFTVNQDAACTASVSPDNVAVGAAATTRNISVDTPAGCAWTATSGAPWVTVSPGGGTGAGTVLLDIAENTGAARTATATVASRTVTISQDAVCTFAISPSSAEMGKGGGRGTVMVQARDGCAWTAHSNVPWITIVTGDSGIGTDVVTYSVDANAKDSPARTGTITIAGQTFTLTQKEG